MKTWLTAHAKTRIAQNGWDEHYFYLNDDGVRHGTAYTLGTLTWRSTMSQQFKLKGQAWEIEDSPLGGYLRVQTDLRNDTYAFDLVLTGTFSFWGGRPSGIVSLDWSASRIDGQSLALEVTN